MLDNDKQKEKLKEVNSLINEFTTHLLLNFTSRLKKISHNTTNNILLDNQFLFDILQNFNKNYYENTNLSLNENVAQNITQFLSIIKEKPLDFILYLSQCSENEIKLLSPLFKIEEENLLNIISNLTDIIEDNNLSQQYIILYESQNIKLEEVPTFNFKFSSNISKQIDFLENLTFDLLSNTDFKKQFNNLKISIFLEKLDLLNKSITNNKKLLIIN